jgi:hypothetical protein
MYPQANLSVGQTRRSAVTTTSEGDDAPALGVRASFASNLFCIFLVLAVLSAAISVAGSWIGRTIAMGGHTDSRALHEIVIGNDVLSVSANMIRFEKARRSGVAARLDIYARWPDMSGYSQEARDDFNHVDGRRKLLFLSFEQQAMSRDMSGRLDPIYRPLIEPNGTEGPAGLAIHDFRQMTGYLDEALAIGERAEGEPFVARCLTGEQAAQSLAPCERDLHVGNGLSLSYRFPVRLLAEWRWLDKAVLSLAEGMIHD